MKLVTYLREGQDRVGVLVNDRVYDMEVLHPDLPTSMGLFLNFWEDSFPVAQAAIGFIESGRIRAEKGVPLQQLQLLAPVPYPTSCRDGYAFRQHVAAARRNRKVDMIPEFDQFPIFYFTNHQQIFGPNDNIPRPAKETRLDYELEMGCIIGRKGKDIKAEKLAEKK